MNFDIKQIRESFGLSQQEFADELGITREMVGQMERGQKKISKASKILIKNFLDRKKVPIDNVPPLQTDQTRQILSMDIPNEAKIDLLVELVALKEGEYALLEKIADTMRVRLEQMKAEKVS